jgi:transposase-like protein
MARCEDFPCCGHEPGDCPDRDRHGRERWRCVECGKRLSLKATSSICAKCTRRLNRTGWDSLDHDYSMNY